MANGMFDEIGEMDLFDKSVPSTRGVSGVIRETSSVQIPSDLLRDELAETQEIRDYLIESRTKANQLANDLNNAIGGGGDTEQISNYLYSQFATSGPMPPTTGSGPTIEIEIFDCLASGGDWKDCTTLGAILQIPGIPQLPSAILGTIFRGKTIREIEEMIKEGVEDVQDIIQDVKDIFNPDVESKIFEKILGKIKEVKDQVTGIFNGDGDGKVTTGDIGKVLGGIKGVILQGAYGVLVNTGKSEIEKVLGLPPGTLLTNDNISSEKCINKGLERKESTDDPWDCSDIPIGYGLCDDNLTTKLDEEGTNCPPGQSIPQVGDDCFTANDEAGKITNVGGELKCVSTRVVSPTKQCQDPDVAPDATGNCPEDYCADGTTLRSTQPFGMCPEDTTKQVGEYTAPTVDCNNPKIGFNNTTFDATASAKYAQYSSDYDAACGGSSGDTTTYTPNCNEARPSGPVTFELITKQRQWDAACGSSLNLNGGSVSDDKTPTSTKCDGNDLTLLNAAGNEVDRVPNHSSCVSGSIDDTTTKVGTTFNCISQNRTTNEDGSCGECLPGYSPDPNNFDECVKDDTIITGEPPGPTTETPPPSTSSSGGGGVGGSGGGMFTGSVSGISYTPQPLPGIQSGAPVNAMASLEGLIGRMLTGNIS